MWASLLAFFTEYCNWPIVFTFLSHSIARPSRVRAESDFPINLYVQLSMRELHVGVPQAHHHVQSELIWSSPSEHLYHTQASVPAPCLLDYSFLSTKLYLPLDSEWLSRKHVNFILFLYSWSPAKCLPFRVIQYMFTELNWVSVSSGEVPRGYLGNAQDTVVTLDSRKDAFLKALYLPSFSGRLRLTLRANGLSHSNNSKEWATAG